MPTEKMPSWFYTKVRNNRKIYEKMQKNDLFGNHEEKHSFF
jgi:hypothetical protein